MALLIGAGRVGANRTRRNNGRSASPLIGARVATKRRRSVGLERHSHFHEVGVRLFPR